MKYTRKCAPVVNHVHTSVDISTCYKPACKRLTLNTKLRNDVSLKYGRLVRTIPFVVEPRVHHMHVIFLLYSAEKTPQLLDFTGGNSGTTCPILTKLSRYKAELCRSSGCKFRSNWTSLRARFLPPRPAHLFGTIQYFPSVVQESMKLVKVQQ